MKVEKVEHIAMIVEDPDNGEYLISPLNKGEGGPVISNSDLDKAKSNYEEALDLCFAVYNLTNFKKGKWLMLKSLSYERLEF